ncbi:hypothetical protein BUY89_14390, partial [Staphylococcus equorum]|uniref:DUF1829 domain-containing protein n=1 Tax=Staphylococcus equorum TaxID=246432 RepID=UPI000D1C33F5
MDNLIIYAIYNPNSKKIILTDDGYTMYNLENDGVYINKSKQRKRLFEEHISAYGVQFNNKSEEVYIETSYNKFDESKHRLLQCLIFLSDMYILANHKVQNVFSEDVAEKLDNHEIAYNRDMSIVGPTGMSHNFDFVISAKKHEKEKFINAISTPNNTMIIKSKVTDTLQAKKIKRHRPNQFIFVLNDSKQSINQENIDFLNESGIDTVNYSLLDKEIKVFL